MRIATKKPRSAADIQADIAGHKARADEATAALAKLRAQRPAMLLDATPDGDAKLDALEAEIGRAQRKVERASAASGAIALLQAELAAFHAVEEEARRQAIYDGGTAAAAEYRRLVVEIYEPAARAMVATFEAMAAQAGVIANANRRLPEAADGPIHLPDPYACPIYARALLPSVNDSDPDIWGARR